MKIWHHWNIIYNRSRGFTAVSVHHSDAKKLKVELDKTVKLCT